MFFSAGAVVPREEKGSYLAVLLVHSSAHHSQNRAPGAAIGRVDPCPNEADVSFFTTKCPLSFYRLVYPLAIPTSLTIRFLDEENFTIGSELEGKVGQPVTKDGFTFTLQNGGKSLKGREFNLSFVPLHSLAKYLGKEVCIEVDKQNKQLLRVTCTHPNPKLAKDVINAFLEEYMRYLQLQGTEKIHHQLNYLSDREKDVITKLRTLTRAQAAYAQRELEKGSFSLLGDPKSASLLYHAACQSYSDLSSEAQFLYESLYGNQRPIDQIVTAVEELSSNEPHFLDKTNTVTRKTGP